MKAKILSFAIAFITLLSFDTAYAQHPNLRSPLTSSEQGLQLKVYYDISGLGNVSSVFIELKYDVEVTTECFNRGQQDKAVPGQSGFFSDTKSTFEVPVKNGRAKGFITTQNQYPTGSCPAGFRSSAVVDATYSNITLKVLGSTFDVPNP
jgi:hypothetical protein